MWRGQPDAGMAFMSDHGEEPAGDLMLRAWTWCRWSLRI